MFKRYRLEWEDVGGNKRKVDFYVHSKRTRNGFMHRACAIGPLPRLDDMADDRSGRGLNEERLLGKRVAKVSYGNRTWEAYPGQTALGRLWGNLEKLKFVDMSKISKTNPFDDWNEPAFEDLPEPDVLFGGLALR